MHKEDIKAAIRKKGSSLAALARAKGLDKSTFSHALNQPQPSADRAIAEFLELSLNRLWPNRYAPDGTRISKEHNTRVSGARHRQKSKGN